MKKTLLYGLALVMAAGLTFSSCDKGGEVVTPPVTEENLAPTDPQNRSVVLEDFTGITCGYCPDGHDRAKALADAYPGKVTIIAVHTGGYADPKPQAGYPDDFRTAFGKALNDQSQVAGYPAGTVNRHKFEGGANQPPYTPQMANGLALSRGGWQAAGELIMTMASPVNLGMKTSWDEGSRTLTIKTETYYTATEGEENNLNIAILENGVSSTQVDYGLPSPYKHTNYIQNNVLRHLVTGQWGEKIAATSATNRTKNEHKWVVPANINIDNVYVAAFVTQGRKEILNGMKVKAKN
jgi:thiol-disulfide isomerase/thioredoxin